MLTRSTGNSPIRLSSRAATGGRAALRAVSAAFFCACFVGAATANAQQQPVPFPWEKDANKFFNQGLPKVDNPIDRRIREGLRKLGLPDQPEPDTGRQTEPEAEPPGLSQTVLPRLDRDGDGSVSRSEYMGSRQRPAVAGQRGIQMHLQRQERLDSRFRAADRNRDGRLTGEEIDEMEGRRF